MPQRPVTTRSLDFCDCHSAAGGSVASMGCSSEVNDPDSTTSVDSAPLKPARRSHSGDGNANTTPARAKNTYVATYDRRRPTRSASCASPTVAPTVPTTTSVRMSPTVVDEYPRCASVTPTSIAPKPYTNARNAWAVKVRRAFLGNRTLKTGHCRGVGFGDSF